MNNNDAVFGHFSEVELANIAALRWDGVRSDVIAQQIGRDRTKVAKVAGFMATQKPMLGRPTYTAAPNPAAHGSVAEILERTAVEYDVSVDALIGSSRKRWISAARQCAMYRLRALGLSYPEIARTLHRGDHTTVMHGVREHARRCGEAA